MKHDDLSNQLTLVICDLVLFPDTNIKSVYTPWKRSWLPLNISNIILISLKSEIFEFSPGAFTSFKTLIVLESEFHVVHCLSHKILH